jgi:hypothetical protein
MKKPSYFLIIFITAIALCLGLPAASQAQQTAQPATPQTQQAAPPAATQAQEIPQLDVAVAAVCKDVVNQEPVEPGISFPVSVGKLFCYTKVTGAKSPTQIIHVWYFGSSERAKVALPVKGISWRTYSSKIIRTSEVGAWHVDVLDEAGKLLKTLQFEITQ